MLIVFGGLPGVGKTTLSRAVAKELQAVYLRIDTIEQALKNSVLNVGSTEDAGYVAACGLAEDNLRNDLNVVADSVNPIEITRSMWHEIARKSSSKIFEIEIICSDKAEHQRRVETRQADLLNHKLPTWDDVINREYEPWNAVNMVVDTASKSLDDCINEIVVEIRKKLKPALPNLHLMHPR